MVYRIDTPSRYACRCEVSPNLAKAFAKIDESRLGFSLSAGVLAVQNFNLHFLAFLIILAAFQS